MKLSEKLRTQLILAVPFAIIGYLTNLLVGKLIDQPWHALCIILPLLVVAVWLILKEGKIEFELRSRFITLFLVYVVLFSVAAGSSVFDFKKTLIGYENKVPSNWFSLNFLGDWRYKICPKNERRPQLIIVLLKPTQSLRTTRQEIINLIKLSREQEAKGIAFDFYFRKSSEIDPLLCWQVEEARNDNFPVFVGYSFLVIDKGISRELLPESLKSCFPKEESQGHLVGYAESDGKVRMIPLYFQDDPDLEALSLKVAKAIKKEEISVPDNGLLQYVKPGRDLTIITYDKLFKDKNEWPKLRDQFVLVGEDSETDTFSTPYGRQRGVILHAYAIHSLLHNHYIKRVPLLFTMFSIYFACFWLAFFTQEWQSISKLIGFCILVSLVFLLLSVLAISISITWLDISYFYSALWLFLVVLLFVKKRKKE